MIYERSAGVVTFRQMKDGREYLLLHYPGGHFDFPKGHMEADESERETALRELKEETGIEQVTWIEGYREMINYTYHRGENLMSKDVIFFLGRTRQKKITISFEHKGSMWLTYDEALEKLTFKSARELLQKAEKFLKKKDA
jgi:8-oxo-dGTP pyrophosphatase MutT (NUDIX family)